MAAGYHMHAKAELIGQVRPGVVTPVAGFVSSQTSMEIMLIVICNTTETAADFSLYHDDDGATFDVTTALHYEQKVPAKTTVRIESEAYGSGITLSATGQLGIQSSVANALTFSIYGVSQDIAQI